MYCRIGNAMRIKRSKAVLKSLTSAFIATVSSSTINIAAVIAAATAISFIPVPGTVRANLIMVGIDFAVAVVAAMIYIKLPGRLTAAGVQPDQLDEDSLKCMLKDIIADAN